jgi:S-adenosylmethionine hydrolase
MALRDRPPVVALLSDLGTTDTYVGVMKTVILGLCPQARIVDLCHHVLPQDVEQAAFLLDTAWPYCPVGTVHVVVVDPGVGSERRILCVEAHGQRFVAPDNGVLTQVLVSAPSYRAFAAERREHFLPEVSQTFHGRDVLAPLAARLAAGLPVEEVGPRIEGPLELIPVSQPVSKATALEAHVVHVDRFGNLVTDLSNSDLLAWQQEHGLSEVVIMVGDGVIHKISMTYAGTQPGDLLALFASTGRLEIAVNEGSAAECLRVGRGTNVFLEGRGPRGR